MTTAYRQPGREIDETEIERAKIHEAAESKRHALTAAAAERKDRREAFVRWYTANDSPAFVFTISSLLIVITIGSIAIMYCTHLWFR